MSLNWNLSSMLLVIRLEWCLRGRKASEVKGHSHHIFGEHVNNMTCYFGCWPRLPVFFYFKVTFSPFTYCVLWKEVPTCSVPPTLKELEFGATSWGVEHLYKLLVILLHRRLDGFSFFVYLLIYLFGHVFMLVWIHGYLFYILGYNSTLLYFFAHIVAALATFGWLLCPFNRVPLLYVGCCCCFWSLPCSLALHDALG